MTEKRIVTPIGFLEILVEIDPTIPKEYMTFTRSKIRVSAIDLSYSDETNVLIGNKLAIPLKTGRYSVSAYLGQIPSEEVNVEIEAGLVRKVTFFFGKQT